MTYDEARAGVKVFLTEEDDAKLITNGYEPLALVGKRPVQDNWTNAEKRLSIAEDPPSIPTRRTPV